MDNDSQNSVNKIKQAEEEGQKIISLSRENVKKDLAKAIQSEEKEKKQKLEEAQKKVDGHLRSLQKKFDKESAEAEIKINVKIGTIRENSQSKVKEAVNFVVKKLISG